MVGGFTPPVFHGTAFLYLAAAISSTAGFPVSNFRNSRICFRRRVLANRCFPNLALSPFLWDIVPSRNPVETIRPCSYSSVRPSGEAFSPSGGKEQPFPLAAINSDNLKRFR
jgi:hypothetical protein